MRVALVRGSLLRPSELDNFALPGVDTVAIASRDIAADLAGWTEPPVIGLPSTGELLGRLPLRVRGALELTAGKTEMLFGLRRALRGVDVAHALELDHPLTLQSLKARDAGACRAVVASVMENIAFPTVPNRVVAERVRTISAGVDHFVAITDRARLHLELNGIDAARITVMPCGVDLDRFRADPSPPARSGPLRVLTVTRLERAKGVEDLVIAIRLLAQRGIDAQATFVGSGPLAGNITALAQRLGIEDRIEVRGPVPWEQLTQVYREHDVFVLGSAPTVNWREQFGFAVVEAMACALPVLVGDSGSLPEVVADAASLIRPHDPPSLADALAALAGDEAALRRRGQESRDRAEELFDIRQIRARMVELYEQVLATPRSARRL